MSFSLTQRWWRQIPLLKNLELDSSILDASGLGLVVGNWLRGPCAAGPNALGRDAEIDQPLLHRVSAVLRQLLVDGLGSFTRGVARDLEADAGVVLHHLG